MRFNLLVCLILNFTVFSQDKKIEEINTPQILTQILT